jgi:membrane protein DedA with SNARE-associated domain
MLSRGTAGGTGFDVLDGLVDFVWRLGHWGYAAVFVASTLESAAFLGLLVPGDTIAIFAGFLAFLGILDLPETIVVAAAGAVLGDSIGYELGRHLGRPWLNRHGVRFGLGRAALERVDGLFARHGGKTVLLGRFVAVVRSLAPFVAGSSRMPYGRFLAFNAAGAILWALGFVLLGYFLGASWWIAERWVGRVGLVAGLIVAGTAAVLLYRHARRRVRQAVEADRDRSAGGRR